MFTEVFQGFRCGNNADLGSITHDDIPFSSAQDCADYIISFGMENRGCDGQYFSWDSTNSICYCSLLYDCDLRVAIEDSNASSYTYDESNYYASCLL